MPTETDAALLAHLKESYGGELPAWLEAELSQAPKAIPQAALAACREAALGDAILRGFAERLAALMPPTPLCTHRVLAHELLLAATSEAPVVPGCAVRALGCAGPCALRCHPQASAQTLALLRQAVRYISVAYAFSPPGEIPADKVRAVARAHLERLPLERGKQR